MSELCRAGKRRTWVSLTWLALVVACGGDAEQPAAGPADIGSPTELATTVPAAPRDVGGAARVEQLAAGGDATFSDFSHVCASLDGALQCWGANGSGQLGDGMPSTRAPLPVRVAGIAGPVSALALGGAHSCALVGGAVLCWGHNGTRQLGAERPSLRVAPEAVVGLPGPASRIVAGRRHSCAVSAGELWCWGTSEAGELGFIPEERCRGVYGAHPCTATPGRVVGLPSPVEEVVLGDAHGCALAEGAVFCWGRNQRGQLGDGGVAGGPTPVAVALPGPARSLSAGADHSCAGLSGGVWCWGANDAGQLGDGSLEDRARPVRVAGFDGTPTHLAAGGAGSCAVKDGRVWCWGAAAAGAAPVTGAEEISGLGGAAGEVAVGQDVACAVVADTRVRCWGENDYGQLGNGDPPRASAVPVDVGPWDDGRIRDGNGDGRITVACLGDSNTHRAPDAAPGWCESLETLLAERGAGFLPWRTVNRGWGGASAIGGALRPAHQQLRYTLENDRPHAVIMAYGTNDLLGGAQPEEVLLAYAQHRQQVRAAGAAFFVALTPPTLPSGREVNAAIDVLNALIREGFPAERVIGFDGVLGDSEFRDGIHLSDAGHARRARAAAATLAAAASVPVR